MGVSAASDGNKLLPGVNQAFEHLRGSIAALDDKSSGASRLSIAPLLHDVSADRDPAVPSWKMWLKAAGLEEINWRKGPRFNQTALALDAALGFATPSATSHSSPSPSIEREGRRLAGSRGLLYELNLPLNGNSYPTDMTTRFARIFPGKKPVIAMVHFGALPGAPLYDAEVGLDGLVEGIRTDLRALQTAGVDAIMFGNENDRPYEFKVDTASTATMAYAIGQVKREITVPFGVNVLWDPMSSVALAAATGASFVREILTGTYASDMGPWTPDAGAAMRYRDRLGRRDLALLDNISAEFAWSLDQRSLPDRARSAVFSSIPDAILVSGIITGEAAALSELEAVKKVLPDTPVLANTGVKHATVADVLRVADGCIVGTALKVDGNTWNAVDPERAKEFMRLARAARGH